MNRFILLIIFASVIIVAILLSFFQVSYVFSTSTMELGLISSYPNLELMDDGYVLMSQIGDVDAKHKSTEPHNFSTSTTTDLEERSTELEAIKSIKVAVELVAAGKNGRALKLLQHAYTLAPSSPEVLLSYGEYLEDYEKDVLKADQLFLKATTISPTNSRALRNRKRTLPIVEKMDLEVLDKIDDKRDELALIPTTSGALRRIKKEAYFLHIYHTAGIEGNTLTLAETRMILETGLSIGGKSIMEHNEILGLDLALKYINTTLVHRIGKICIQDILEIHKRILGHADPMEGGKLRSGQVFVSEHVPPPPERLFSLMTEFINWLNSDGAQQLHPIKYAALAHYKLVYIHPFFDGNGRTARLLMNFLLMQAGYPPIIIRRQDRHIYYNRLQLANDGDTRPFIRFIAHCTEKTIDVYLWATKNHLLEIEQNEAGQQDSSKKVVGINSAEKDLESRKDTQLRNLYGSRVGIIDQIQRYIMGSGDEVHLGKGLSRRQNVKVHHLHFDQKGFGEVKDKGILAHDLHFDMSLSDSSPNDWVRGVTGSSYPKSGDWREIDINWEHQDLTDVRFQHDERPVKQSDQYWALDQKTCVNEGKEKCGGNLKTEDYCDCDKNSFGSTECKLDDSQNSNLPHSKDKHSKVSCVKWKKCDLNTEGVGPCISTEEKEESAEDSYKGVEVQNKYLLYEESSSDEHDAMGGKSEFTFGQS